MLVDESHLTLADDGAWHTSSALAAVEVPPSIAALLAARLDQLPRVSAAWPSGRA